MTRMSEGNAHTTEKRRRAQKWGPDHTPLSATSGSGDRTAAALPHF